MSVTWYDGATLKVELGFGSTPYTAPGSISWTDVSAYVRVDNGRSVDIGKGRSAERDTFDAGTMTITFDSRDRRFDPDYLHQPSKP